MAIKNFQDICYTDAVQLELDVKKKLEKGLISEEIAQRRIQNIVTFRKGVVKNDTLTVVNNLKSIVESVESADTDDQEIAGTLFRICWFYIATKSLAAFLILVVVFFTIIEPPQKQKPINYRHVRKTKMNNDLFSILSSIPFSRFVRQ
ncbi:MAG: hypothetical protein LBP87_02875 [Planctomycetaceae bacterium]|nr:hypothetical protein [Planctomycetaceae bacterium]